MKNYKSILLLTLFIILSTRAFSQKAPKYILQTDSTSIISPHVEVTDLVNGEYISNFKKRDAISENIITYLEGILNKKSFVDIALMHKDYLSVNKVLERYYSVNRKHQIMPAPEDIIINNTKYSILITVYNNYTNTSYETAAIMLSVVNNETKQFIYYNRIDTRGNLNRDKDLIRILNKLINNILQPT